MKHMAPERKLSRPQGVLLLSATLLAAGLLTMFSGKARVDRKPVMIGGERIVAREQLAEVNGPMCEFVPASATEALYSASVIPAAAAVDPQAPKSRPSKAERDALARRAPKYVMKDPNQIGRAHV